MKHQREAEKVIYSIKTLLTDLKSCSRKKDLQWGRRIHLKAVESRHESNIYVATELIRMYSKCGSMMHARRMFDNIHEPDVVCWTALLMGYADNGDGYSTLNLFSKMKASGCLPDSVTYVAALKACTSLMKAECLRRGRELHSEVGGHIDIFVQSTLVYMYSKCGSMEEACLVFESIHKPNVVCWNALLLGYAENGDGRSTLKWFSRMKASGCAPDSVTYVAALKACTSLVGNRDGSQQALALKKGREIHSEIGCNLGMFVQNTLIDMYAKCGSMPDARRVFESFRKPDVVSWNALLLGYVQNADEAATLELFSRMKSFGCTPNSVTYVAVLKACTSMAVKRGKIEFLRRGRDIHSEIGCNLDIFVQNTLIDMYAKCGSMREARIVFDSIQKPDVVSWTALLLGYSENRDSLSTLDLFSKMKASGCAPDSVAFIASLKACTSLARKRDGLKHGREIHSQIGSSDLGIFLQNTLIDMYAKCNSMGDARLVFDNIQKPDLVSWNNLLLGYAENGDGLATLELFSRMKASGCEPDSVTYIAVLKASGLTGAFALGRKLHLEISEFTAHLVACLVDFYAKCGCMVEACEVFDLHSSAREVSTWNALLAGYASFGDTVSVFKVFEAMQDQGFQPDAVTFVCLLSCCSHAGLVQKAREYFEAMFMQYGITPTVVHYTCMVDALGRANQLNEAFAVLQGMACDHDAVTWMTLMGSCCKWKNVEIGRHAFQSLIDMDQKNSSAYLLMAQIYSSMGMLEERERLMEKKTKLSQQALR